jgi:uncharacterized protein (TIGR03435 family)
MAGQRGFDEVPEYATSLSAPRAYFGSASTKFLRDRQVVTDPESFLLPVDRVGRGASRSLPIRHAACAAITTTLIVERRCVAWWRYSLAGGRMPRRSIAFIPVALAGIVASGQGVTFEVASIKPAPVERRAAVARPSPDRFYVPNVTLRLLIMNAYGLADFQLLGGPDWMRNERWDVSAKADRVPTSAEMRAMVQRLLEERFALKAHHEMRELPTYDLVLARTDGRLGPQIKPAAVNCEPFRNGQRPVGDEPRTAKEMPVCTVSERVFGNGLRTEYFVDIPMSQLARNLQATTKRVVIDKTGLRGRYDITLMYEDPEARIVPGLERREGPALATAMQEQLGLKLESSRSPVQVLVIDSAERPTPD